MTRFPFLSFLRFAVAAMPFAASASAHSVWIEDLAGKSLVVRFGEMGGEVEKSPGRLDSLQPPVAAVVYAKGELAPDAVEVLKKNDHFLIADAAPKHNVVFQTAFPVMMRPDKDGNPTPARWPQFYARWHVPGQATSVAATLDLVPSVEPGKVTVYFRGKPLPNAKVRLLAPGGDEQKAAQLEANAEGVVSFEAKPPGLYVMTLAGHSEEVSGFYLGKSYAVISHNAALTWRQP